MAYTIVTSWDFRTATGATARASRRNSYTLTESGTPNYTASGVELSGAGERLYLTLPAELKHTDSFWLMAAMRRIGTPSNYVNVLGFALNDTDTQGWFVMQVGFDATGTTLKAYGTETNGFNYSDQTTGNSPALNTDFLLTVVRTPDRVRAYISNTLVATTASLGSIPTYQTNAHLVIGPNVPSATNINFRYDWMLHGTGDITDTEIATIQASPNTYIYPPAVPFRSYYHQHPG